MSVRSQNYVLPQFETSFLVPDLRLKKLVSNSDSVSKNYAHSIAKK